MCLATAEKNFTKILFTPETYIIDFEVNGKTYKTILQDIQYHPVTDKVLHADFLIVKEDKPITVTLPITLEGSAAGVMRGGKPKLGIKKVKVCGLIKDLPDYVKVNISDVNINEAIKVKDLAIENVSRQCRPWRRCCRRNRRIINYSTIRDRPSSDGLFFSFWNLLRKEINQKSIKIFKEICA